MQVLDSHSTTVDPAYHGFYLIDPTCDESDNVAASGRAADASGEVGWSDNAVAIRTKSDLVPIHVVMDLVTESPPSVVDDQEPDLLAEGTVALPGGYLAVPKSYDESLRAGVALLTGPGTYGVRIVGFGRVRAKQIWDRMGARRIEETTAALRGVEHYRFWLWQVATEPAWPDDEE